jgi:hypothetical protein
MHSGKNDAGPNSRTEIETQGKNFTNTEKCQ